MTTEPPKPIESGDLINAVRYLPIEAVEDLLVRGADPKEKDNIGNTALHYVAGRKDNVEKFIAIARLLLKYGALIDEKGYENNTPLMRAVGDRYEVMVRFLLDNGASLDERNKVGYNAVGIAQVKAFPEIIQMLKAAAEARRLLAEQKAARAAQIVRTAAAQSRANVIQGRLNSICPPRLK
jgi:ankyrin repeat protein